MLSFIEPDRHVFLYRQDIVIAPTNTGAWSLPSLLGRDILNRWNMSYRPVEHTLELDVVSADATIDLR